MAINPATPQDTQDHMLGAGALSWDWWHACDTSNLDSPDWSAVITAENGDGGETTATVDHAAVMRAARKIISDPPQYASTALLRECRNLVFDADETDFDACTSDELLQFMVLGEIVFG